MSQDDSDRRYEEVQERKKDREKREVNGGAIRLGAR